MKYASHIISLLLAISSFAQAEIYKDIGPLDNLKDLKEKFPSASFTKLNPAWAQKSDVMYQITGTGLPGKIVLKCFDHRPAFLAVLDQDPGSKDTEFYKSVANETDEEAISVEWVRWLPDTTIPVSRLISKYGPPDKSGFTDESLQPYRHWERKGLTVYLADDEKSVTMIDYSFTLEEYKAAYLKKRRPMPDWLVASLKKKRMK